MVVLLLTVKASIYEQNLYEKLQKYDCWSKTLKLMVLLLTAAASIYTIKLVVFVDDRKSIDLLTKSIRKASKMRLA